MQVLTLLTGWSREDGQCAQLMVPKSKNDSAILQWIDYHRNSPPIEATDHPQLHLVLNAVIRDSDRRSNLPIKAERENNEKKN